MSGTLGLGSPWTREAVPEPLRSELRALIPDGWTVGLKVDRHPANQRARYGAWANDERSGAYAVHSITGGTAEAVIRAMVEWIHDNETWTLGPYDAS